MVKQDEPLVSVIIPVYNGADYLSEAIESVRNQTYGNLEIIIVNDGSTDSSLAIAESYKPFVRVVSKRNGGTASALNCGIRASHGELIGWLSHDDLYEKDMIAESVSALRSDPEAAGSYCDYFMIDEAGTIRSVAKCPDFENRHERYLALFSGNFIHGCATLIRRRTFDELGFYSEELHYSQDLNMWLRILREKDLCHIRKTLIRGRNYPTRQSLVKSREVAREASAMLMEEIEGDHLQRNLLLTDPTNGRFLSSSHAYLWLGNALPYIPKYRMYVVACHRIAVRRDPRAGVWISAILSLVRIELRYRYHRTRFRLSKIKGKSVVDTPRAEHTPPE